jgi:hypothetical protein
VKESPIEEKLQDKPKEENMTKEKEFRFDKPIKRNIEAKEYIEKKKNEPVPEPVISKDERNFFTIIKVSSYFEIKELFEKDEPRRKILVSEKGQSLRKQ